MSDNTGDNDGENERFSETDGGNQKAEAATDLTASVSSEYKVRGKTAAGSGTGVLGYNTATSGTAYGVEGATDSSDIGAAGVRANASNGAYGLHATARGNKAIRAHTPDADTIKATTDGFNTNAVWGDNKATNGLSWGVCGDTDSTSSKAYGVRGRAPNDSGAAKGVGGKAAGEADGAAGVHGEATATSGKVFGVDGVTQSSSGAAAGVRARASNGARGLRAEAEFNNAVEAVAKDTAIRAEATENGPHAIKGVSNVSGATAAIRGDTDSNGSLSAGVEGRATSTSSDNRASGVRGRTDGEGTGSAGVYGTALGTSGTTFGVDGETKSSDSEAAGVRGSTGDANAGVWGRALDNAGSLPNLDAGDAAGVFGESDKSAGAGVYGRSKNHHGVVGQTESSSSYGVRAFGDLKVVGYTDVSKHGLSAFLDGAQTIDSNVATTVVFDQKNADHWGAYDDSTGVFSVPVKGDYDVSFTIKWKDTFSPGVAIAYGLQINGSPAGQGFVAEKATPDGNVTESFSRTLFGLDTTDTLEVVVKQISGGQKDISGNNQNTFLTISKVG